MSQTLRLEAGSMFSKYLLSAMLVSGTSLLASCAMSPKKPPEISYDSYVPPLPPAPAAPTEQRPKPLRVPPGWAPARGGAIGETPAARVENANAAARVEPRREGYYNAIQIYPWSEGALYQVYAAPGQITDIALEPGESLTGEGPIAAGDTARWIIGNTESGSGIARRVHVLVKPSRADIATNLIIATDRRSYMLELRSGAKPYMPAVSWSYPALKVGLLPTVAATPVIPDVTARNYRYGLTGDSPPWKPVSAYDDGRRVYVEFPRGIVQGELPPIFVIGPDGEAEITNSRVYQNLLIVDRLFGAAELRLGAGKRQQTVRIARLDGGRTDGLWHRPGDNAGSKAPNPASKGAPQP
ncbi:MULTISPECIES: P-type conjugative transfer protein TrbG [unclassified Mesorhizobium]|uniref:P-type conjugative transfer protein TrbG n=1 Tax=unclassified Mesorhizobium TaxID=325217 RepID=UPI000FD896E7|nr:MULTISPECIES: P-type conjugative transfer protein TrbG [unclassified Mesorhizobium]TGQ09070.1 P-type conjugative transfer protein TrbG [Mesorhizobium sp. M2E.F.Ca.ET.219.01.1.1]TGT69605.1 P-type conjugative transfer protein TrbG [Mesorhizobium sp. M2E.F.Ca.ET.166.01.1.1]TGW01936.1 P-type conjugative transfer protein TrbG [Mesorhizobium sp. M2E.F.Ca.ET.154.01.1.1]